MNAQAARQEQAWADRLADQAVQALLDEVALSPKPAWWISGAVVHIEI